MDEIRDAGRLRAPVPVQPISATTGLLYGREVVIACSNDYLGLAWDPRVRKAASGGGSGGSRLISGTRPSHVELESELERKFGRPALVFPSTWHANLSVFQAALEAGDKVASDALNHASIIDGIRLSRAQKVIVPHAQPQAVPTDVAMIALESLYSMDGDVPDLRAYPRRPWLAVDEAHAVGALGPDGRGIAASQGVTPDVLIGALGKAYGAAGGFVIGPPELKELLVNVGRSFIFTTAAPEPVVRMALAGIRAADAELRERLAGNAALFRTGLRDLGWSPLGVAHVVPVVVGPKAMEVAATLLERGVYAPGIRWPTVPAGQERIRFTVSAAHTPEQIEQILEALGPPGSS
jgi:7-keto-8-aminopelargonate synthetase-like enzyme